jgi:hypothetical protein
MSSKNTLFLVALAFLVISGSWYLSSLYTGNLNSGLNNKLEGDLSNVEVDIDTSSKIVQELLRVPDDSEAEKALNALDEDIKGF